MTKRKKVNKVSKKLRVGHQSKSDNNLGLLRLHYNKLINE